MGGGGGGGGGGGKVVGAKFPAAVMGSLNFVIHHYITKYLQPKSTNLPGLNTTVCRLSLILLTKINATDGSSLLLAV